MLFVEFGAVLRFCGHFYGFWSSFWLLFWNHFGITRIDTLTQNDNSSATKDMKHRLLGLVNEGSAPDQPSLASGRTAT